MELTDLYQWQTIAALCLSALVGFLLAWWIRGALSRHQRKRQDLSFEHRSQELHQSNAQLQQMLDALGVDYEQLQGELRTLQGLNATLNRDLQHSQHSNHQLQQTLTQTQTQLRRLDAEFSSYRSEAEIRISSLEGRYHLATKTHEEDIEKYEDSLLEQIRRLESAEIQFNESLRERDLDIVHLREEREFLNARNQTLEEAQLTLRQRTQALAQAQKRIAQLENLNQTRLRREVAAQSSASDMLLALDQLRTELELERSAQHDFSPRDNSTALIQSLQTELERLRQQAALLSHRLDNQQQAEQHSQQVLQQALSARDAQLARLQQRLKPAPSPDSSEPESLLLQQLTLQSQQIQSLSRLLKQTQQESQIKLERLAAAVQRQEPASSVIPHPALSLAPPPEERTDSETV